LWSLFIGIITCFLEGSFMVILIFSLGLPLPLMIFWMFLIFLAWRFGKVSLILRTSLVLMAGWDTWTYHFLSRSCCSEPVWLFWRIWRFLLSPWMIWLELVEVISWDTHWFNCILLFLFPCYNGVSSRSEFM